MRLRLCTQAHPGHEGGEGINATRDPVTLPRSRRGRHHRREAAFVQHRLIGAPGSVLPSGLEMKVVSLTTTGVKPKFTNMMCFAWL